MFYPEIKPYHESMLSVSDLHRIYFEESGNPDGIPVLFIHGGPGGPPDSHCRRFFNPVRYRIIMVDKRGCGKSTQHGELQDNTTQHLISDFEALRLHLKLEAWVLFGGSWGSTLALAYAQMHPHSILAMVLRGIFLGAQSDLTWMYQGGGASDVFPDYWEAFHDFIPEAERGNFIKAYYDRLHGNDLALAKQAAKIWSVWEACVSKLYVDPKLIEKYDGDDFSRAFARIETHYFHHQLFLKPNQLLNEVHKIRHIPAVLVHGRYDMCCPFVGAWRLHRAWPEAKLIMTPDSGHSAFEPGNLSVLVQAMDNLL
jgi:proline iminopeptidase